MPDAPSARPLKAMADSATYLAEIVGEESLQGQRMQAGAILDLMDVVAGQVAITHCSGPVVTLSFDRVDLIQPIEHGDLIRLEGRMAAVGNSSTMIEVEVFRQNFTGREFIPVQRSFVTMVAIDLQTRRPNRNIPGLRSETPEEKAVAARAQRQKDLVAAWTRMHEETTALKSLKAADVEDPA
ncbi:MAG TPA: acyl-CoA thioesterase, partial [bacterium]